MSEPGGCSRPNCRFVHPEKSKSEVANNRNSGADPVNSTTEASNCGDNGSQSMRRHSTPTTSPTRSLRLELSAISDILDDVSDQEMLLGQDNTGGVPPAVDEGVEAGGAVPAEDEDVAGAVDNSVCWVDGKSKGKLEACIKYYSLSVTAFLSSISSSFPIIHH